ncbi:MAG: 3-isopropylmalate dehydrogenase [Limnochordia bacterium]|jgi:3-isopropylmalate dehydrogenase|nr:3-isopropylmalate dehydrogenase [Bacillota bacterium]
MSGPGFKKAGDELFKIALLPGDGIGPEIVAEAVKVLQAVGQRYGHQMEFEEGLIGGAALDQRGEGLPQETLDLCRQSDAILMGAVGGPKWDELPGNKRPEAALLGIRKGLGLFANLRPAKVFPALAGASSLKREVVDGIDLVVVRELTGGIYFGRPKGREGDRAIDTMAYTTLEVERIARVAFELARKRKGRVTSVDKANVLETSRLWREVVMRVKDEYPEVHLEHMYVDNCAMQLLRDPGQFDVILTGNMFGDILSDEAAMLTGSLGMLPSASLGEGTLGLYEPVHGSAPDIAGKGVANPLATILSAAMLLRYSLGLAEEADKVEWAVATVLDGGYRTPDIAEEGCVPVGTREMGDLIVRAIQS